MITNSLFALGVPSYNRADLLNPNLIKYTHDLFPNTLIFIVDNGAQKYYEHENIKILRNEKNAFVSKSWNQICDTIFLNYNYAYVINDDIGLQHNEKDITDLITQNPNVDFFNSYFDWCSFILPKNTFNKIGRFDERFKIWFQDSSYNYMMKKVGCNIMMTTMLNPGIFVRNATTEKDPILQNYFELDRQSYLKIHKGGVGSEME